MLSSPILRRPFDEDVRHQPRARADLHFGADDAVRPDLGGLIDARRRIHDGRRMDQ